ncbi:MAG: phosphoglycerate kinase [Kiloniellales bacterium]
MGQLRTIEDLSGELGGLAGKRLLVRVDLNVPLRDGKVTDATRIERCLPTLRELADAGAKLVLLSHFGRPKGRAVPEMSLRPIAAALADAIGRPVAFAEDCLGAAAETAIAELEPGGLLMLENLRFHTGEEKNDPAFVAALAALGEGYVNDAFSTAHRAHASTEGLAHRLPAAAGRLMQEEIEHLAQALDVPERPVVAIVGGAKVSTKLELLGNLIEKVDVLVIGGGMANTFLHARGVEVGASLCERGLAETAAKIDAAAAAAGCRILLPEDAVVAAKLEAGADAETVALDAIPADKMILDVGPKSIAAIEEALEEARTLVWNGPLGAFEFPPFDRATMITAGSVIALTARGSLLSVAGGGDTVAALAQAGAVDKLSYVSTAGGAFLEWLEGKTLPGVAALMA